MDINCDACGKNSKYVCVVRSEHDELYSVKDALQSQSDKLSVVYCDYLTEGAACTTLLAASEIDNDTPLLIANSDQFLEWDWTAFVQQMVSEGKKGIDGSIICFHIPMEKNDTKWSYAKLDDEGFCTEVREKVVISPHATVGLYYWSKGSDYVKYAKQMIEKDIRVKGEFYVAPVYNEAIADGQKHSIYYCKGFYGLGVPRDLTAFEANYLGTARPSIAMQTAAYIKAFNDMNIDACKSLMAPRFSLTDPAGTFSGRDKEVLPYIQKIFNDNKSSLSFTAVNVIVDEKARRSVIEFELKIGDSEYHGTDVIEWSADPLMLTLRAYLTKVGEGK